MMSIVSVKQRVCLQFSMELLWSPLRTFSEAISKSFKPQKNERTNERLSTNNFIKLSDFPLTAYKSGNTKFPPESNPTRHTADETILWYNYHYHSQSSLHTKATANCIPRTPHFTTRTIRLRLFCCSGGGSSSGSSDSWIRRNGFFLLLLLRVP